MPAIARSKDTPKKQTGAAQLSMRLLVRTAIRRMQQWPGEMVARRTEILFFDISHSQPEATSCFSDQRTGRMGGRCPALDGSAVVTHENEVRADGEIARCDFYTP